MIVGSADGPRAAGFGLRGFECSQSSDAGEAGQGGTATCEVGRPPVGNNATSTSEPAEARSL